MIPPEDLPEPMDGPKRAELFGSDTFKKVFDLLDSLDVEKLKKIMNAIEVQEDGKIVVNLKLMM